jgi:hypothetical protein
MPRRPSLRRLLLAPAGPDGATIPVEARAVFTLLAALRPGRSWVKRAENLYIAAFTGAILIGLFWALSRRAGTVLVEVAGFYHFLWGPPLIMLIFLGALRYSTVQGFVSFSEPDCLYLLPAPLRRRDLVWPRLATAMLLLGIVGALAGVLAVVGSAGSHAGTRIGEAALAGFALGVLIVAGSWHVQRLRWATVWALRLTIPALGLVVLLGFAQSGGHAARFAALWSGPWGWGILPLASGGPAYGVVGLGLLCALAVVAGISVLRTAGDCSLEGFRVRARTRSQVVASLYALDYRSAGVAGRGQRTQTWQSRVRLRLPRRSLFVVPWHGAVALLRSPVRLVWGIVLAGAGTVLLALQPTRQGAVWAGAVALYLAASSLLEPLRLEVDSSGTAKVLLPWRFERILWLHCLLPAALMIGAGLLALAGGLALGYLSGAAAGSVAILTIPLSFVVILAAALSARRGGRVSTNMVEMASMDTTGFTWFLVVLQLAMWAILALIVTIVVVTVLGHSGFLLSSRLFEVVVVLAILAFAMQRGLTMKRGAGGLTGAAGAQRPEAG